MPALSALPRRRSLVQSAMDALMARIRVGDFQVGDRLPTEPEVMAELGVSRTVVREAVSRLQASGVVETRHGIGTFVVASPSGMNLDTSVVTTLHDLIAMLELRISLETDAAALAASRRTDGHIAAMRGALDDLQRDLNEGRDGAGSDFQFHLQIALATGNPYFENVFRYLGTATIPRTHIDTAAFAAEPGSAYLRRTNSEHEYIFEAIKRQEPETARAAMRMHLSSSQERLRRASDAKASL
ncbi:MAG: FadR family transcriptional regulator [Alphaproteobacteria bacterium]|nr:FadR family transcriptional regulator [Alphaproteobacteria bacterium]MDE1985109.1 FadR family transcriptional regulator [Alphaproteobacteria bacterium]MDE2161754.1 FadR family transcriptional regulator [Alphaproteobacteria bacterium]MDE2499824.1 FadR family transcriptional regulator [Alphaproteobacteria bacterium]